MRPDSVIESFDFCSFISLLCFFPPILLTLLPCFCVAAFSFRSSVDDGDMMEEVTDGKAAATAVTVTAASDRSNDGPTDGTNSSSSSSSTSGPVSSSSSSSSAPARPLVLSSRIPDHFILLPNELIGSHHTIFPTQTDPSNKSISRRGALNLADPFLYAGYKVSFQRRVGVDVPAWKTKMGHTKGRQRGKEVEREKTSIDIKINRQLSAAENGPMHVPHHRTESSCITIQTGALLSRELFLYILRQMKEIPLASYPRSLQGVKTATSALQFCVGASDALSDLILVDTFKKGRSLIEWEEEQERRGRGEPHRSISRRYAYTATVRPDLFPEQVAALENDTLPRLNGSGPECYLAHCQDDLAFCYNPINFHDDRDHYIINLGIKFIISDTKHYASKAELVRFRHQHRDEEHYDRAVILNVHLALSEAHKDQALELEMSRIQSMTELVDGLRSKVAALHPFIWGDGGDVDDAAGRTTRMHILQALIHKKIPAALRAVKSTHPPPDDIYPPMEAQHGAHANESASDTNNSANAGSEPSSTAAHAPSHNGAHTGSVAASTPSTYVSSSSSSSSPCSDSSKHGAKKAKQAKPSSSKQPKQHRTRPCRYIQAGEPCKLGEQCTFMHEMPDGTGTPLTRDNRPFAMNPSYRTKTCRHWLAGKCSYGDACNFKHPAPQTESESELGPMTSSSMASNSFGPGYYRSYFQPFPVSGPPISAFSSDAAGMAPSASTSASTSTPSFGNMNLFQ